MPWPQQQAKQSQFDRHLKMNSCTTCPGSHLARGGDLVHGIGSVLFRLSVI